jgi:hypothetical protein
MPARNPEAVRQRAIAAATRRAGQPTAPTLDPVFVALNQGQLPAARGPHILPEPTGWRDERIGGHPAGIQGCGLPSESRGIWRDLGLRR